MTILEFAIIAFMVINLTVNPPVYYPPLVISRPLSAPTVARDIPMISGGDSILLHLPRIA